MILPVQIHDLYPEDKALIEKEMGGFLRPVEFIYMEPGVKRPLTPKDSEEKNSNNTNYRNQINKVANAIDEIIHGLRSQVSLDAVEDQPDLRTKDQPTARKEGEASGVLTKSYISESGGSRVASEMYYNLLEFDPLFENLRKESSFQDYLNTYKNVYNRDHERFMKWLKEHGML